MANLSPASPSSRNKLYSYKISPIFRGDFVDFYNMIWYNRDIILRGSLAYSNLKIGGIYSLQNKSWKPCLIRKASISSALPIRRYKRAALTILTCDKAAYSCIFLNLKLTYHAPECSCDVNGTAIKLLLFSFRKTNTGLTNSLPLPLISTPTFRPIAHHQTSPSLKLNLRPRWLTSIFTSIQSLNSCLVFITSPSSHARHVASKHYTRHAKVSPENPAPALYSRTILLVPT